MEHTKVFLILALLFAGPVALARADKPLTITLEDIFSKVDSISTLSYESKITSADKMMKTSRVIIRGTNVYVSTMGTKMKQIAGKSYVFLNRSWLEIRELSISTVIRYLKEAQTAKDTRIVGQDTIGGDTVTVIEYTQSRPAPSNIQFKITLWVSNTYFVPIKIQAANTNRNIVQTEVISNVSVK